MKLTLPLVVVVFYTQTNFQDNLLNFTLHTTTTTTTTTKLY